jgi:AraC-like DNA-binding protein
MCAPDRSPRISTVLLRALVGALRARGISAEALLGSDAEPLYLEPADHFLPRSHFQALLARAVELTGDPAFSIQLGFTASESSFGLMAPLIGHAPTLRRALELVTQFQPLLIEGVQVQLVEHTGVARLRCELQGEVAMDRAFSEFLVAGLVRTLQAFGCTRHDLRVVCFRHARPAYCQAYSQVFAGCEQFSQPYIGVEFSARALERAHLHHHSALHSLMLAEAERNLRRLWRPQAWTERVQALVSHRSAAELPTMAQAARELGLSVRSLRRYLEDEGSSYRALTQSMLRESACSMLRNPSVTLHAIAHTLGFSNPTAFHRAFRRWAKLTPAEYRAEFLSQSDHA